MKSFLPENTNLLAQYFEWHFGDQPKLILRAWQNLLRFNLNYFSTPLLFKTLFSPWKRYRMSYGRGFDLHRYTEVFIFNSMSRVLGAMVRIVVLIVGCIAEVIIFFGGGIFLLGWILLPALLLFGIFFGSMLIFL